MNGHVFEDWFQNTLLPNLPKDRKVVIVMDNAKYHSRLLEKNATMAMRKDEMIEFMKRHDIDIPTPLPTKPVLLEKVHEKNIKSEYIIDKMAKEAGYDVLRLPPNHCIFNPIEMVWNQLKHHARHSNIYTSQPAKVVGLLREVCEEKISVENCQNYVNRVVKIEEKYRVMDHIVDNEVEPFIIHASDSENESDDDL